MSGSGNVTLTNSHIGNGSTNGHAYQGANGSRSAIYFKSSGAITLNGNTFVTAGPYSGCGISLVSGSISCLDSSNIFTNNYTDNYDEKTQRYLGNYCIQFEKTGNNGNVIINSSGIFYCTGPYVVNSTTSTRYTFTKGHFACRAIYPSNTNNRCLFRINDVALVAYKSTSGPISRYMRYINGYSNNTATFYASESTDKNHSDFYYLKHNI